jgi:hypothetical protein
MASQSDLLHGRLRRIPASATTLVRSRVMAADAHSSSATHELPPDSTAWRYGDGNLQENPVALLYPSPLI